MQTTILPTKTEDQNLLLNPIQNQVFIGGCSRSGTTLLGAMLGVHPSFICSPESQFKVDLLRKVWPDKLDDQVDNILQHMAKHWRYKIWQLPFSAAELRQMMNESSYAQVIQAAVWGYSKAVDKTAVDTWVDHTPENISYAASLLKIFPRAKFIHIIRDGRAVAASIMPLDWGPNSIIKASRWWMRMISFGLAAEASLPKDQIIRVYYEDLVAQPEATLKQLCDFLRIEYLPEMTQATGFKAPSYTTRQHQLVGIAPNKQMATRWRQRLSPRQIEIFENQTRDFLHYLGYTSLNELTAKPPSFWEIQMGKGVELIRGEILNKIKWLIRSYPMWLSSDFYAFAKLSDSNN